MTAEQFSITPVWPGVASRVNGMVAALDGEGGVADETPAAPEMSSRDLWRALWAVASGRGADPCEIAELAAQFRRAEPLGAHR